MPIRIVEIHPAETSGALNTEWLIVENAGTAPFSTRNCTLSVSRRGSKKRTDLGTLDPGFVLAPGERVRVVTGHPGRKAHGQPPEDGLKNYNLFLAEPVLRGTGTVISLSLRTHNLATAEFDPAAQGCVAGTAG
jgi:hypothetical protein